MRQFFGEGNLVMHKMDFYQPKFGVGTVISYDRWTGLYKVWWSFKNDFEWHVKETLVCIQCDD